MIADILADRMTAIWLLGVASGLAGLLLSPAGDALGQRRGHPGLAWLAGPAERRTDMAIVMLLVGLGWLCLGIGAALESFARAAHVFGPGLAFMGCLHAWFRATSGTAPLGELREALGRIGFAPATASGRDGLLAAVSTARVEIAEQARLRAWSDLDRFAPAAVLRATLSIHLRALSRRHAGGLILWIEGPSPSGETIRHRIDPRMTRSALEAIADWRRREGIALPIPVDPKSGTGIDVFATSIDVPAPSGHEILASARRKAAAQHGTRDKSTFSWSPTARRTVA